jgi:multiple sugar transport system substrate-binding protein
MNIISMRRKGMKRVIMIVLILAMGVSIITCRKNDQQASGGKIELSIWMGSWWEEKAPGIKADFEAEFPQYTLKIDCLPINGYFDNAAVAILAGNPPDILDINTSMISTFASRGLLTDVTESVGSKLNRSDFVNCSWDTSLYEGKLYGSPNRGYGDIMYYNKTMFDEAGVAYPTDNWNYDDMLEMATKITVPGQKYGLGIAADASNPGNVWASFAPVLWYYGSDFLSADNKKCLLNTPEAVAAITWWTELYTKHKVVPDGIMNYTVSRDIIPLVAQNQVAMTVFNFDGINLFSKTPGMKWGVVQVPKGLSSCGAWTLTIPVSAVHKEAAVDYLLWYARPEVQSKHNVIEPANIAAWEMGPPWNQPEAKELQKAGITGKTFPTIGNWAEVETIIITELQQILEQRKTPQQGADAMVARIDPLL